MEVTYKYTHNGHDLGHAYIGFDDDGKADHAHTFSGDICHFPPGVTAWRPAGEGFISADEPEKVLDYLRSNPDWKTEDTLPGESDG